MANINVSFALQTLEGPTSNIVTLSRSAGNTITLNSHEFLSVSVATSTTDVQTNIPALPNKVITIENVGLSDITVKFNANTGTPFVIPKVIGTNTNFIVMNTSTPINSLFCSNADAQNVGALRIFIGG